VTIDACVEGSKVTFVITDSGKAFDPTAKEELDITAGVEERPIGGLGIHLVRTIMDTVSYERKEEQNILTITKTY
jgi:sigma-B regulation protein RsbU (phosphoserine phosphatase)